ncbi:unnamed protein product [Cyclocybe aegerita]|uniref:Uncharacterized protein n=1 Tax=Cyclocybe aegerita TaxID=1973307 RepID=A0A8S0WQZ7_CYCAE|nr:unnamed protein product [Cyclocybe aegerita]
MIDSRNPDGGSGSSGQAVGGVTPVRLRRLELHDCTSLGEDVMRWLESRVTEVICSEPAVDRSPLVHPYL